MAETKYVVREFTSGDVTQDEPDFEYKCDTLQECAERIEGEMRYNAGISDRRNTRFTVSKSETVWTNVPFKFGGVTFI